LALPAYLAKLGWLVFILRVASHPPPALQIRGKAREKKKKKISPLIYSLPQEPLVVLNKIIC